jgi:RsiW-degrading membrane proteinase PrsW (M82 family)
LEASTYTSSWGQLRWWWPARDSAQLLQSRGNIGTVEQLLLLRGILSPAEHAAWTGLTTVALWLAATARWSVPAVGRFLATFALAVVLHALWDGLRTVPGYLIVGGVSLALLHRALLATHTVLPAP